MTLTYPTRRTALKAGALEESALAAAVAAHAGL